MSLMPRRKRAVPDSAKSSPRGCSWGHTEERPSPSNSFRENRARSPAQSNKVPPPDGILFIGDSMIRNFDADNSPNVLLFSYPGITAGDLNKEMTECEYMPPPSRIGMVILHVGSNDASRTREDKTVEDCCDVIMKCVETLREFYPAAKLWVSAILPRLDDDQPRARQINDLVRKKSTEYMRDEVQY